LNRTLLPAVLLALVLLSSGYVVTPAKADETCSASQPCYYGYDTSGNYAWWPTPFPSYWQTTYNGKQQKVTTATITVSTQGFPSDYTTELTVNGKTVASLAGGGTAQFQIKGDDIDTFQVSSYVNGKSGERFYTASNSWTSQKGKEVSVTTYTEYYAPYYYWWDYSYSYWYYYYPYYVPSTQTVLQPFDQSYTFKYQPQYQLTIQNDFGGSVSQAGWYPEGSTVSLNANPTVPSSQDTRSVFVAWTLNGADVSNPQTTITMNQPYSAVAKYKKQYYLDVRSDYGSPTGSGWYDEGSTATIQVEKQVPEQGGWGALGANLVFDHWSSGDSADPARVTVDSPKAINAVWRENLTTPIIILLLVALAVAVLLFLALRGRMGTTRAVQPRAETTSKEVLAEAEESKTAGGMFCPECGAKIARDSKFCKECGTKIVS
jgi:hypothetical protein